VTELLSRAWLDAELERIARGYKLTPGETLASVREVCALTGTSR
jgi:hypothetical protein